MKKLLKKVMMCATMMAALVGFTSCEDDLDIQTNYPFEVEVMPVPTKVLRGQTVEIRCHLAKEGDYTHTLYTIRWFLYDGTGSLRMENGTILQPNDRYLLENETFRLYYTSASTDAHKFIVVVEDSNGNYLSQYGCAQVHRGRGGQQRQQPDADVQLQQREQKG